MNPNYSNKEQPCWKCAKALGGCSWSREFEPVKGWDARVSFSKYDSSKSVTGYAIKSCPEFELESGYNCDDCRYRNNSTRCTGCCFNPKCKDPQHSSPEWDRDALTL